MFISDNGASSEGGPNGSVNENKFFNNVPDDLKQNLAGDRRARRPEILSITTPGAGPTRATRRSAAGSARPIAAASADPFIVHWPKGIKAQGQDLPAISRTPSTWSRRVLEALGVEPPTHVRGVTQSPIEGVSFAHVFEDAEGAKAGTRRNISRCSAHRSIYHDGWRAVCPWPGTSFKESGAFFGAITLTEDKLPSSTPRTGSSTTSTKDPTETTRSRGVKPAEADRDDRASGTQRRANTTSSRSTAAARCGSPTSVRRWRRRAKSYVYYPGTQMIPENVAAQDPQ